MDWFCLSDSQARISLSIHSFCCLWPSSPWWMMNSPRQGASSLTPRRRQNFPSVEPLRWCTDLMKLLPHSFSSGYVLFLSHCVMPCRCTESHGSLSVTYCLSRIYLYACMSPHAIPHEYTDKMHIQTSTQAHIGYVRNTQVNINTGKELHLISMRNSTWKTLTHACSNIYAHKHHVYTLWSCD